MKRKGDGAVAGSDLTQDEADALLEMDKYRVDEREHAFPTVGERTEIPLQSRDRRERFLLDLSRGRIDLARVKYQNRARKVVVLARLELNGPSHLNPDGVEVPRPHIHIYREGYADKWAFPLDVDRFADTGDIWRVLDDFMEYCNITQQPNIIRELFA